MISKFLFNFSNFVSQSVLLARLLTSGILFSTVVNAVFVAKLLTLYFSDFKIVISLLRRPLVSGIFFSSSVLSVSHLVFKVNPLVSMLFTLATNLL